MSVDGDRLLVVRQRDFGLWSLVGGGIEPMRWVTPADVSRLDRHHWIDDVIDDAVRTAP